MLLVNWKQAHRQLAFYYFKTRVSKSCKYFQGILPCHPTPAVLMKKKKKKKKSGN